MKNNWWSIRVLLSRKKCCQKIFKKNLLTWLSISIIVALLKLLGKTDFGYNSRYVNLCFLSIYCPYLSQKFTNWGNLWINQLTNWIYTYLSKSNAVWIESLLKPKNKPFYRKTMKTYFFFNIFCTTYKIWLTGCLELYSPLRKYKDEFQNKLHTELQQAKIALDLIDFESILKHFKVIKFS